MPIIKDITRKDAFSPRLKDKREIVLDERSEMTPGQIRAFDNAAREANRWIENIGCAIDEPSREQAKRMDDTLRELVEQIEDHRYRLVGA